MGAIALVLGLTLRFGGSPSYLMIYSAPPEDPLGTLGGESGQQYAMYIKVQTLDFELTLGNEICQNYTAP